MKAPLNALARATVKLESSLHETALYKGASLSSTGIAFRLGGYLALDPVGNALRSWQHGHGPTKRHTGNEVCLCLGQPGWLGSESMGLANNQIKAVPHGLV